MVCAISIGAVVYIVAAMAGDMSQDLKTGFLVGATPEKQQYGELIGSVAAAAAIGAILHLLNTAWGFGSSQLPAPQAMMMKMVIEGVMGGNLPWSMILIGVFCAVVFEILRLPVLPLAIGIYLPIHLSAGIMVGGLVRHIAENRKYRSEDSKKSAIDSGVLYSSGLVAGEGLVGILLAVLAVIKIGGSSLTELINVSGKIGLGNIGGAAAYLLLAGSMLLFVFRGAKENEEGLNDER